MPRQPDCLDSGLGVHNLPAQEGAAFLHLQINAAVGRVVVAKPAFIDIEANAMIVKRALHAALLRCRPADSRAGADNERRAGPRSKDRANAYGGQN